MGLRIKDDLVEKAQDFPESSYGANQVSLILTNKKKVRDVILAWGSEIVKIGNRHISNEKDLDFNISDIIDVESEI